MKAARSPRGRSRSGSALGSARRRPWRKRARAAEIVLAIRRRDALGRIIGGRCVSSTRLRTLACDYPPRAAYFRGELRTASVLARERGERSGGRGRCGRRDEGRSAITCEQSNRSVCDRRDRRRQARSRGAMRPTLVRKRGDQLSADSRMGNRRTGWLSDGDHRPARVRTISIRARVALDETSRREEKGACVETSLPADGTDDADRHRAAGGVAFRVGFAFLYDQALQPQVRYMPCSRVKGPGQGAGDSSDPNRGHSTPRRQDARRERGKTRCCNEFPCGGRTAAARGCSRKGWNPGTGTSRAQSGGCPMQCRAVFEPRSSHVQSALLRRAGYRYSLLASARRLCERGVASWYGPVHTGPQRLRRSPTTCTQAAAHKTRCRYPVSPG